MSKPFSGQFEGTVGAKRRHVSIDHSKDYATQNRRHVVSWAQRKAEELAAISKTQRDRFNTATVVYDESNGKYYYGRNNGIAKDGSPKNAILFGDETHEGILPKHTLNDYVIGNCAEVDAINNALNDKAELKNLHITTIHTTPSSMGKSKPACKNCTYSFKGRIKRNYTGWHQEESK